MTQNNRNIGVAIIAWALFLSVPQSLPSHFLLCIFCRDSSVPWNGSSKLGIGTFAISDLPASDTFCPTSDIFCRGDDALDVGDSGVLCTIDCAVIASSSCLRILSGWQVTVRCLLALDYCYYRWHCLQVLVYSSSLQILRSMLLVSKLLHRGQWRLRVDLRKLRARWAQRLK